MMKADDIRQILGNQPFRPMDFHLNNGDVIRVSHPEMIVTDWTIVTVDPKGRLAFISTDAVTSIKVTNSRQPAKRARKGS